MIDTGLAITPTLHQLRTKYHVDLQVVGLQTLDDAARSSQPAHYIACILDVVRDSYHPKEVTYLTEFIMRQAERRGLLG